MFADAAYFQLRCLCFFDIITYNIKYPGIAERVIKEKV